MHPIKNCSSFALIISFCFLQNSLEYACMQALFYWHWLWSRITLIHGQPHWLPADAQISCTCMPVATLSTSSTPVCLSGLLQLYSSSRCLHPSGGTCPQPLPSCMCRAVWSLHSLVAWANSLCSWKGFSKQTSFRKHFNNVVLLPTYG